MRSTLRRRLRRWRRQGTRPARGRGWTPGIAISAIVLAAAGPASARTSWGPPHELSGAGSAPLNLAATAGTNPARSGGRPGHSGDGVLWRSAAGVQAVVRAAKHSFGKPRAIAESKLSMPDLRPQLAFDGKG